jgi:hypothetical protein
LLVFLTGSQPRSAGPENPVFGTAGCAGRIGARTILKWDYNLEIHHGAGTHTQAGSDGDGR